MKTANLHCLSNVSLPIIYLPTLNCRWVLSSISLMTLDDNTYEEIDCHQSQDSGKITLLFNIQNENMNHQPEVLHLGKMCQDQSLQTSRFSLQMKQSCGDTVIAFPPLSHSWNPNGAMAPPLLTCHNLTLHNRLYESDCAPPTLMLPLPKSNGDQTIP